MHKKILIKWAGVSSLCTCFIYATTSVTPRDTSLTDRKSPCNCGSPLWASDRAHLSPALYRDLAATIVEVASGGLEEDDGSGGSQSEPAAPKRRRLKSVITLSQQYLHGGKGWPEHQAANHSWLACQEVQPREQQRRGSDTRPLS
jgi:hypothetical protein